MKTLFYWCLFALALNHFTFADNHALPEACSQQCVSSFGEVTGTSPSGVTAYSNCNSQCVNPEPHFVDGIFTGIKWQCVEYARRWLLLNEKVIYGDVDIAADIWHLPSVHTPDKQKTYRFKSILNGSSATLLQRGDLLIYAAAYLGTGHVAVVLEVDEKDQTLVVGEQNYSNQIWQEESAREIKFIFHDQKVWLLDPYLIGWKRIVR